MLFRPYRDVLALPGVTRLLAFAVFARGPIVASSVVLTLYVVNGLGLGYGAAGLVGACATLGAALGGPWRGRALDRIGLRRAIVPSIVIEGACWVAVPLVSYPVLLAVAFVSGLLAVPIFTVVRQSVSVLVGASQQDQAFALDSIGTEISYMVAPAAGVVLSTAWSPSAAAWVLGGLAVVAGAGLWWFNPALRSASEVATEQDPQPAKGIQPRILGREMIIVLGATFAALAVLSASEVGVVAHLRAHHQQGLSSVVLTLWGGASLLGGLVAGGRRRALPVFGVLLGLAVLTIPVGLVPNGWWLLIAILPSGFFCAPTLAATAAAVSRLVPEHVRGEAMGWYGTATTAGIGAGAPLAGWAIDRAGPWAGFALVGALSAVVAVIGLLLVPWGIDRPDPPGSGAPSGVSPTRRLRSAA